MPDNFRDFYTTCNGFECIEDIFNFLTLNDISEEGDNYGPNWFYFAEYMIYSDMWGVRILGGSQYEIFNGSFPDRTLTTSLTSFLRHLAAGHVFEKDGLYDWQKSLGIGEYR